MIAPAIAVNHATLTYQQHTIFRDVNLILKPKRWTALLGPSGVGKSSLLRFIAQLTTDDCIMSGDVYADNHLSVANQIAYMGQSDALLPWLNALENVCLGSILRGNSSVNRVNIRKRAKELLSQMGLDEALTKHPHQLSGGMRQRVALARTIIENKSIVLMDEPFSALDAITRFQLQELAAELFKDKTVLFITHDPAEATRLAHDIYIMQGTPVLVNHTATLESATPRKIDDAYCMTIQAQLLQALQMQQTKRIAAELCI